MTGEEFAQAVKKIAEQESISFVMISEQQGMTNIAFGARSIYEVNGLARCLHESVSELFDKQTDRVKATLKGFYKPDSLPARNPEVTNDK